MFGKNNCEHVFQKGFEIIYIATSNIFNML